MNFLTVYNLYFLITLNNIENKLTQLDDYNFRKKHLFSFFAARVTFLFASVVHELRFACS